MTNRELLKFTVKVSKVLTDRTSSNGTPYSVVIMPDGEWVFAWEGDWKEELDNNTEIYRGLECDIFCIDKEEDPEDHFYNLEAIVPTDPEKAEKLLELKTGSPEISEEEKERKLKAVREAYQEVEQDD